MPDCSELAVAGVGGMGAVGGDVSKGDEVGSEVCEEDVFVPGGIILGKITILGINFVCSTLLKKYFEALELHYLPTFG